MFRRLISLAQKEVYQLCMLQYEIYSFRITCLIGAFYMLIFTTIDYWRAENYASVLVHRPSMILILLIAGLAVTRLKFTPQPFYLFCIAICTMIFLVSISMDIYAGMPPFFLPNFFCLLFYVFNAVLGYPLRWKVIHSLLLLMMYLFYGAYFSPHQKFQLTQIWNLFENAGISLLIGFLIERYKRINFVQREELVAARKKIELMSSMKSKLISILSHDLKSPLNNLKGLLHLQDSGLMTQQESMTHFKKVGKSVDGITHLLQNLVHWSKSQLEGFKPEFKTIEVEEIVRDVLYSIESLSIEKNISILNKVDNTVHFFGDREMIKLIIRNILTNSIKFSYPGSSIEITASMNVNQCIVAIHDNGIGMTPKELESLFLIKKNSKLGTQKEGGTGLGLMLAQEFVYLMNGEITVDSEEGKGSTFHIVLPTPKS